MASSERGVALLVAMTAGVASQQAANARDSGTVDDFAVLLDTALDMYAAYFHPSCPDGWTPWPGA